ncbi:hypothetical protein O3P69_010465 [Scylla paramamosain]|uniref:G-protein coupled receptors family 3 profile domain-containing protein n=1 Tax=Scylla paramamosain TaxID=85552 RepID=A0AAW0TSL8_SCYPA
MQLTLALLREQEVAWQDRRWCAIGQLRGRTGGGAPTGGGGAGPNDLPSLDRFECYFTLSFSPSVSPSFRFPPSKPQRTHTGPVECPCGRYIEGSGRHCRALVDAGVAGDVGLSLTYRVTSAHKIKLTDKQLLQWLTPILLIMLVYLSAWSLSATPSAEVKAADSGLKYKQCKYDWWDHSLAADEVLFLMQRASSTRPKYISWAVYNIALVNIVMVAFHLIIFPDAGPDVKYLFGFLRTQFSTSTTVLLIFGPKFYRIVQGTGDQYDNRARAKGVTASFSLNGLGVMNDEPADLSQENEELKEEIQKLAAQMEFMKIVHMEMNNRHLKPKPSGYFSDKNPAMAGPTSPSGPRTTDAGQENAPAKLSSPCN